ncbi:copper chaperone CopZ [Effusibacillus lacus]|uniref:Copper chaperone CopZ n=1 Tax=Effusibacillus lacus TaxID=1348429 RepID=A0A292YT32_9BACL|nr:copper chaperone CopZ [Effusibacillus lacus]TCS74971.1 copper chaperone [Effusibacillus lacus]GAX91640.1 copper resistance protein CopZ [Effusibacillus lacus]
MAATTATLNVKGMSCNHCVNTIEKALKELKGVQTVNVDLKGNKVTVSFDETVVGLEIVKEAIEEAGYDVA